MKFYKSEDVLLSNELDRLPLHRTLKIEKIIHKLSIKVNGFGGQAKRKHRIKRDLSSVFPAYAGVILRFRSKCSNKFSLSRIRGGDPNSGIWREVINESFPHTRG